MNLVYLWEDQIPNLDPEYQEDPEAYFYDLLYEGDRFSWIVDDYEAHIAWLTGITVTTGMSVIGGTIGADYVIIVEYVSPGSPAEAGGIKRGDIITAIDGQQLTKDNRSSLFYQETATFEFSQWDGVQLVPIDKEVTITAILFKS